LHNSQHVAGTKSSLYDEDFLRWTEENAALLRSGNVGEADLDHIAEELEDMGKSERREMESRVRVVLVHLLKLEFLKDPLPQVLAKLGGHAADAAHRLGRASQGQSEPRSEGGRGDHAGLRRCAGIGCR